MAFNRLKDMDHTGQVHIFDFSSIHTFELNISLIKLFSLIFKFAKPQIGFLHN